MIQNCTYFFSNYIDYKLYSILSVVLALLFILFLRKVVPTNKLSLTAYVLFSLGTFANAFDRFNNGCVLDYLDFFGLFKYNLFDFMICMGSIILAYMLLINDSKGIMNR